MATIALKSLCWSLSVLMLSIIWLETIGSFAILDLSLSQSSTSDWFLVLGLFRWLLMPTVIYFVAFSKTNKFFRVLYTNCRVARSDLHLTRSLAAFSWLILLYLPATISNSGFWFNISISSSTVLKALLKINGKLAFENSGAFIWVFFITSSKYVTSSSLRRFSLAGMNFSCFAKTSLIMLDLNQS